MATGKIEILNTTNFQLVETSKQRAPTKITGI